MMHKVLLAKPTPIPDDCSDPRWKWFKGCLGALDGTFIDVRVPEHEKGRYRTRKGDIAVNVLGVCNPNMQFIFVLSGWEGSAADSRVLRDAINRPHGLCVPTENYYLCDNGYANAEGFLTPYRGTMDTDYNSTAHVNTLEDEGSSQQKRRGQNKDRTGPRRTWTMLEEEALINGLKALVTTGWKCDNGFRNGYLAQLEAHMKKIDPSAKGMRYKSWPFFPAWREVFGKDRATGERGWDPTRAGNERTGRDGVEFEESRLVIQIGNPLHLPTCLRCF
ncbi:UNVERIFIED_CONTAM: hypothetical protein Sradi_0283200 [Sesamum radiatum]|uniref:DDE Tnp4 domain-containing protein n=1 Tax=Sesamum radiatum TaxID=300843 RepID=A0AAW2W2X6_SESRA